MGIQDLIVEPSQQSKNALGLDLGFLQSFQQFGGCALPSGTHLHEVDYLKQEGRDGVLPERLLPPNLL